MTGRDTHLNARQLEVLRWVGAGCPAREWPDWTYKTVALALQNRRLITVSKRGGIWSAVALDAGQYYLAHGRYPDGHLTPKKQPQGQPPSRSRVPPRAAQPSAPNRDLQPPAITPTQQLLHDIEAAGGTLTRDIKDDRTAYGSLVSAINRHSMVPKGRRLVMESGGTYYQKVFRIEDLPAWLTASPREVVEAPRVGRWHPAVAQIRDGNPALFRVEVRTRALRILHSIATEAQARGHHVAAVKDVPRGDTGRNAHIKTGQLLITIESYRFYVSVRQRDDYTPHTPTHKELEEQQRSQWSRPPRWDIAPGKRLWLSVYGDVHYGWEKKWTDSKTLKVRVEDHLAQALLTMEKSVARDEERKTSELRQLTEQVIRKEAAELLVKGRHTEIMRAKILDKQLATWQHVRDLREYLGAMAARVDAITDGDSRDSAAEWLYWCVRHIEDLDPLHWPPAIPSIRPPTWQEHASLLAQIMAEMTTSPPT